MEQEKETFDDTSKGLLPNIPNLPSVHHRGTVDFDDDITVELNKLVDQVQTGNYFYSNTTSIHKNRDRSDSKGNSKGDIKEDSLEIGEL